MPDFLYCQRQRGQRDCRPRYAVLPDVLRNHLGLVGTNFGCGLEQCGCCMVLIDGRPEKSCGKAVSTVAGKQWSRSRGSGRASGRTRCNRLFSTSRPGNAATACPGSSSPRRHCSTATRRRAGARSRWRSTTISAAVAAMCGFCAPSNAPPRESGGRTRDERCRQAPCRRCSSKSAARSVGRLPRAGQGAGFDRPGRDRPGRPDRDAADRGRGARCRARSASCCRPATPH